MLFVEWASYRWMITFPRSFSITPFAISSIVNVVPPKFPDEILFAPPVFFHGRPLPPHFQGPVCLCVLVHAVRPVLVAPVMAQAHPKPQAFRFLAVSPAKYLVPVQRVFASVGIADCAALVRVLLHNAGRISVAVKLRTAFLHRHSCIILSISCGVAVSISSCRHSCTIRSISRAICFVSYTLEP